MITFFLQKILNPGIKIKKIERVNSSALNVLKNEKIVQIQGNKLQLARGLNNEHVSFRYSG